MQKIEAPRKKVFASNRIAANASRVIVSDSAKGPRGEWIISDEDQECS